MFNWTTTTILNSLKDYTTGADLVKVWDKASDNAGFSGAYPVLKIKRDHTFESRYVTNVYKALANNPILCEITVDCNKLLTLVDSDHKPGHGRLSFYVALEGSEESIYANDWYQKGKPFSIGFEIAANETGATLAAKIKKNAEKYGVVTYGKKVFDLSVNDAKLTIKGTHEYQRFKNAGVAIDDVIDEILVDYFEDGETASEGAVFALVKRGVNGFGTYNQLIKDLRLPTAHHNKWKALKEDEKPVVGAKYNQYIINYCAPSMANPGFTVIGQHNMSATTHVFWVNQDVDAEFQAALTKAGITPEVVNQVTASAGVDTAVTPTEKGVKKTAGKNYSANHEQKIVDVKSAEPAKSTED